MNDYDFMQGLYEPLMPKTSKPGEQLPDDALVLGVDPQSGVVRYVTMRDLATSLVVAAGTGAGKSNALRVLLRGLLRRAKRYGEGFAVIDTGNLAWWLLSAIATSYPELAPRVFYADFSQRHGKVLGFDPLAGAAARPHFSAAATSEILLRTTGHSTADRILVARVLYHLAAALIELKLRLTDARIFLERGARERLIFQSLMARLPEASPLRSFWEDLAKKSGSTADSYLVGPSNRVAALVFAPPLKRMVAAPIDSLDLRALMDQGGIAIFNCSRVDADVTTDGQIAFAGLVWQAFRQRFEERKPDRSKPFTLVCDEAGFYLPKNAAETLFAARKHNLRVVVSFQAMSQLIPPDGDRTLYDAVLATQAKLILGNLPFSDCKILGEETYLRSISPMEVKHERIVWDPVLRKVVVHSNTDGGGETHSTSTTTTGTRGRSRFEATSETAIDGVSAARSTPGVPGAVPTTIDGTHASRATGAVLTEGESEAESKAHQRGTAWQRTWAHTQAEQWITDHVMRTEPQFSPLEEQIFAAAKHLKLAARGHGVLLRPGEEPVDIRINYEPDIELEREDMEAFLEEVFTKECYSPAEEIDRLLDDSEQRILTEARSGPRVIESTSGRKKAKEGTPVPAGLFQDAEEE
jgi:hypothetical protein